MIYCNLLGFIGISPHGSIHAIYWELLGFIGIYWDCAIWLDSRNLLGFIGIYWDFTISLNSRNSLWFIGFYLYLFAFIGILADCHNTAIYCVFFIMLGLIGIPNNPYTWGDLRSGIRVVSERYPRRIRGYPKHFRNVTEGTRRPAKASEAMREM